MSGSYVSLDNLKQILENLVYEEPFIEEMIKGLASNNKTETGDGTPVGCVMAFAGSTPPPSGWLICDGREVGRVEYKELFDVIGIFYGSSNASSFKVPDYREAALVGVGTRGNGVSIHDTYALGQFKDDQFANHTHAQNAHAHTQSAHNHKVKAEFGTNSNLTAGNAPPNGNYMQIAGPNAGTKMDSGTFTSVAPAITATTATNQYTGATSGGTHGKRVGLNYIIKAK